MTNAEKGFFLSYIDCPLSKSAGWSDLSHLMREIMGSRFDHHAEMAKKRRAEAMVSRGAAGGLAGILAGGGLSAVWGKLHDNPSAARDLFVGMLGGAVGSAGGVFSGVVSGERALDDIRTQRQLYGA